MNSLQGRYREYREQKTGIPHWELCRVKLFTSWDLPFKRAYPGVLFSIAVVRLKGLYYVKMHGNTVNDAGDINTKDTTTAE